MEDSRFVSSPEMLNKRKKVLYVDDITYNLITIRKMLSANYEVYPSDSAAKMFEIIDNVKPDIILLDVNMPDISGFDAIIRLKSDERYAHIPVIFLTGKNNKDDIIKGLSLGAADFVLKPVLSLKLIECIENNLDINKRYELTENNECDKRQSILAVDDVSSILKSIQFLLQDQYKIFLISKPESVIEFLRNKKPDLILLDYLMPVLTGFDLIPMIRALPGYKDTPIIIITTEGTLNHVNEARALGAIDFLVKPFLDNELQATVSKYLTSRITAP